MPEYVAVNFISPFSTWGTNSDTVSDERKTSFPIDKSIFIFLLALDFKVDPLGRPRFFFFSFGSLKGEDDEHSLSLGSGNGWKEKNLCMISFHGFNVKIGLKLQCAVTTCYAPMPF